MWKGSPDRWTGQFQGPQSEIKLAWWRNRKRSRWIEHSESKGEWQSGRRETGLIMHIRKFYFILMVVWNHWGFKQRRACYSDQSLPHLHFSLFVDLVFLLLKIGFLFVVEGWDYVKNKSQCIKSREHTWLITEKAHHWPERYDLGLWLVTWWTCDLGMSPSYSKSLCLHFLNKAIIRASSLQDWFKC